MTPARWQKIEELYHGALELDQEARFRYLAAACGGDNELRQSVEGLLAEGSAAGAIPANPLWEAARTETMSVAGLQFGVYQVTSRLGAGGMGTVFLAVDTRLGRNVAIKVTHERYSQRFEREGRAIAALNHPNICTLYDVGPNYMVMEMLDGETLSARIRRGRLPLEEVLRYGRQIAAALAEAHAHGIVHRDLKPGNIMLTRNGLKVLDFGLAKQSGAPGPDLTETRAVMGTPAWMAPEQAKGEPAGPAADLFALGLILYEMTEGRLPVTGASFGSLLAHGSAAGVPPFSDDVKAPAQLTALVSQLLESAPERRLASAEEVRNRLDFATARPKRRWNVLAPLAGAIVIALAAAGYFRLQSKPMLTDKDTIVLADFTNTTGDPVFDGTLRQGLAIQLEQSPFLSLVSDDRVQHTLGLMGQPADAPLTPPVAREICQRTAGAAVLDGYIKPVGSQYILGLSAKTCKAGDVLDEEQTQVARKEDILSALGQIARKFRTRVESLAAIRKHDTPLQEATTSSLEALKAFSAAFKVLHSAGDQAALPLFRRTVEIDPKFALAYAYLGRVYGDSGESRLSAEANTKAWQLRDHASDRERFFIDASYYMQVTGNLDKARETFELEGQTYPREYESPGLLSGVVYPVLGRHEQAADEARRAIALDPEVPFGYVNLATALQFLDRLGEAETVFQRATERKILIPDLLDQRYDLAFLRGDKVEMDSVLAQGRGKPGAEDWLFWHQALVLAYSGHLRQARAASGRAAQLALQAGQRDRSAQFEAGATLLEAFFGNVPEARRGSAEVLKLSKDRDAEYGAALSMAFTGDSSGAQALASDLEKRFPEDTSVRISYIPVLNALLALNHGEPTKAVEALQTNVPYELGVPLSWFNGSFGELYPVYVRGEAYLAAHQGAQAAAEFQKILDHRGIVANDPIGALARLQLGRAFVLSGDTAKAKAAYQDFLTLWKDADPDIPALRQARAELAGLP
jgi:serine/threonine protein kinase/tetratricopeptide (TPR) repeat protein